MTGSYSYNSYNLYRVYRWHGLLLFLLWFYAAPVCSGSIPNRPHLTVLKPLAISWQPAETWYWQGQQLMSQRFSSQQSVSQVAQAIQRQLPHVDLHIQRLTSSWLLSFNQSTETGSTHYLLLLSEQPKGSQGWLSSMQLNEQTAKVAAPVPRIFAGLYQQSWAIGNGQPNQPKQFMLRPSHAKQSWQQLNQRLQQQQWQGEVCQPGHWCEWHKQQQKLWVWVDASPKHTNNPLWHVLWWPKRS